LAERGHALEVLVDQRAHAPFEELDQGLAGAVPVVLAPFDAVGVHRPLIIRNAAGKLLIVALCGIGGAP
jgi:hypothetical protein